MKTIELSSAIYEAVEQGNLQVVNTKSGRISVVLFNDFKQASEFANQFGGELISMKKREGEDKYTEIGSASDAFDMYSIYMSRIYDNNENCIVFDNKEEFLEAINEWEQDAEPGNEDYFNSLRLLANEAESNGKLFVISNEAQGVELVERYTMEYSYDVYKYCIGVAF